MNKSSKTSIRTIIDEFAKEINTSKVEIDNSKIIPFRDDREQKKIRKAYKVPIEYLRFRKDNGRIASDVLTWENSKGLLNETTDHGQSTLKRFLEQKDPDPTLELTNSILKYGQDDLAVITCDGFLINGNRRKMVMENLLGKYVGDERFKYLNVVILPGKSDGEPLPSNLEIEQLENRYQLEKTGKAEYYGFDKALSIKRKTELGMSLEEQLRDDSNYSNLNSADLKKIVQDYDDNYLKPLECIDKYLSYLNRPGHYNTISGGKGDSEGRWQAFLDYYKLYKKLLDEKQRIKLGVQDDEIGKIEDAAFKIIRKRDLGSIGKKAHQIMREFPKLLANSNAKKELFQLVKISSDLPPDEILDEEGNQIDEKTKDAMWGNKYAKDVFWHVQKAYDIYEQKKEHDTPIELLNASLDKLNHTNMDVNTIEISRLDEAMILSKEIQSRANEIEHLLFEIKKNKQKLANKYK